MPVRALSDRDIFQYCRQSYSGSERDSCLSVFDRSIYLSDDSDIPEETLELGGAEIEKNEDQEVFSDNRIPEWNL